MFINFVSTTAKHDQMTTSGSLVRHYPCWKLVLVLSSFTLLSPSNALTHLESSPTRSTTISGKVYEIVGLNTYHNFTTTSTSGDILLFPISELPPSRRFRVATSVIDSYFIKLGTKLNCHRKTEKGLVFVPQLCCDKPLPDLQACADQASPFVLADFSSGLDQMKEWIVKDDNGEEYIVITVVKTPECPNLSGTKEFPTTPVPYGIRVSETNRSRLADLTWCSLIAIMVLIPTAYLIDFKEFWASATSLA